jgi:hypothetical protein
MNTALLDSPNPNLMANLTIDAPVRTFGDFWELKPTSQEYLILGFSPSSIPIQKRWRNNGLSADFLADYVTTFLPCNAEDEALSAEKVIDLKGTLSYIANELLENAIKYHASTSPLPIDVKLQLTPDAVIFQVTNSVDADRVVPFQALIQTLLTCDPGEFYIQQLERTSTDGNDLGSGLGLVTMIHDYNAKLSWCFQQAFPLLEMTIPITPTVPTTMVTTMVQLSLI